MDGSHLLSEEERNWEANTVFMRGSAVKFSNFVHYSRAVLHPIIEKYKISYADGITVAGAVASKYLGYSNGEFKVDVGRCDSSKVNPAVLPDFSLDFNQFVAYYQSIGLSVEEGTALMGAHTLVADGTNSHNGVQQYKWSNKFYNDQNAGTIKVTNGGFNIEWSAAKWFYSTNDANIAPQNVENKCPFSRLYKDIHKTFAHDEKKWNEAYAHAYRKMTNIGAIFSNTNPFVLEICSDNSNNRYTSTSSISSGSSSSGSGGKFSIGDVSGFSDDTIAQINQVVSNMNGGRTV
eukprot:Pgem_evm1s1695